MQIKSEIMDRPRDITAFKQDAAAMFERLKTERLSDTPTDIWRSKLRRGGLMEADYIRSCLNVTGEPIPEAFNAAIEKWNTLQTWERLLGLKTKFIHSTPSRFADTINIETLSERQDELEKTVKAMTQSFFDGIDGSAEREAAPIVWKN